MWSIQFLGGSYKIQKQVRLELYINGKFWDYADTGNFYTTPELLKTVIDQLKKDNERFIIDADWEIIVTKKSRLNFK